MYQEVRGGERDGQRDATENNADWACLVLSIRSMCELFTFDPILLGGESKRDKGRREKLKVGAVCNSWKVLCTDIEFDVLQAKGMLGITSSVGIFTWSEQKVEGHPNAINGSLITDGWCGAVQAHLRN